MRKYVMTSVVLLPLLLSFSHAAQVSTVDPSAQAWIFSSDEGGTTAYLGVDISDITADRLSALKLKEEMGVEVTMVDQDAPAGKAGIREHDVILSMNGTSIESKAQLQRMIHETPPGRVVTLGLSRDGQPMTVKVQLADKHKEFRYMEPNSKDFHFEMPEMDVPEIEIPPIRVIVATQSGRSGLTVENITPQLGEFFGVKNGNGVLVRAVEKGSRAEKAGFRAGDVIIKINDQQVHDTSDFNHAVRSRGSNSISVGVVRDKKEQNLNLSLPERKESGDALQEDSFDSEPMIQAESAIALSELQSEIAQMQPQMEVAAEKAAEYSRKAAEEVRKSLCDEQKKLREESRKQREQLRKQQEEMRNQMERMRHGLRGTWLDI